MLPRNRATRTRFVPACRPPVSDRNPRHPCRCGGCCFPCCCVAKVVFGPGGMGFTLMKDAVSRALVTRLAPGGMAFRLGVRTGAFGRWVVLVDCLLLFKNTDGDSNRRRWRNKYVQEFGVFFYRNRLLAPWFIPCDNLTLTLTLTLLKAGAWSTAMSICHVCHVYTHRPWFEIQQAHDSA